MPIYLGVPIFSYKLLQEWIEETSRRSHTLSEKGQDPGDGPSLCCSLHLDHFRNRDIYLAIQGKRFCSLHVIYDIEPYFFVWEYECMKKIPSVIARGVECQFTRCLFVLSIVSGSSHMLSYKNIYYNVLNIVNKTET